MDEHRKVRRNFPTKHAAEQYAHLSKFYQNYRAVNIMEDKNAEPNQG